MKKILFLFFLSTASFAQIHFEKGYFQSTSGNRTECLIKNKEWLNNPSKIEFQRTPGAITEIASVDTLEEFGIGSTLKYKKYTVSLDTSFRDLKYVSTQRNPEFKSVTAFLQVLVEGNVSLLYYQYRNSEQYFIQSQGQVQALIYKPYMSTPGNLQYNESYKQQIRTVAKCEKWNQSYFERISFQRQALIRVIEEVNACLQSEYTVYRLPKKKAVNLSLKTGYTYGKMYFRSPENAIQYEGLPQKFNPSLALEAEFILPYNKNKWAILLEPSYQFYEGNTKVKADQTFDVDVKYHFIAASLGVRHYFHLNDRKKVFLQGAYLRDFPIQQNVSYTSPKSTNTATMKADNNFALSLGLVLHNRWSLEVKGETLRNKLTAYYYWFSTYRSASLQLGYKFLR